MIWFFAGILIGVAYICCRDKDDPPPQLMEIQITKHGSFWRVAILCADRESCRYVKSITKKGEIRHFGQIGGGGLFFVIADNLDRAYEIGRAVEKRNKRRMI